MTFDRIFATSTTIRCLSLRFVPFQSVKGTIFGIEVDGEFVFLIWYKNKVRVTLNLCENVPKMRQKTPEDKHFKDSAI